MDDSDSSLSSTHSTDDEELIAKMTKPMGIGRYFKPAPKNEKEPSPEPPKRAPSPPHEYVFADNDAIAFIVMFRSRFNDAFPKSLPHYGPQDIERGLQEEIPEEHVERLLCALLSLVLNRKKDVEKGHYNRALEDAISTHKSQWPAAWNGQNPLPGEKTFNSLTPEERLTLLKTLVLWALNSSEAIQTIIKDSYKQTRRDDDKNQPKSVQPWFSDSYRRKYYLIEGIEDTHFRVYRENDAKLKKTNTWFSVAGTIEEVTALADKFQLEGTSVGRMNHDRIKAAIPRFEAGEEKRRRRDYRLARKAAFARPEPGFSLYEGRTRGKRMRYTYSDGEDDSDVYSGGRRSTRNSGYATPQEAGPTITASGRQVKSRVGGMYGESMLTDQRKEMDRTSASAEPGDESDIEANGGGSRPGANRPSRGRYADGLQSESESDAGGAESSGHDWSGNEEESDESEPDFEDGDEEDDMDGILADADNDENTQESLVVKLSYRPGSKSTNGNVNVNGIGESFKATHELSEQPQINNTESTSNIHAHSNATDRTQVNGIGSEKHSETPNIPTNTQQENRTLPDLQHEQRIPQHKQHPLHQVTNTSSLPVQEQHYPQQQSTAPAAPSQTMDLS